MRVGVLAGVIAAGCALAGAGVCQPVKWDLECRYDNGSIAFMVQLASHRTQGDMYAPASAVTVTPGQISFHVSAKDTTLLQDFDIKVDRGSMKWTSGKPGWGGTCRKL